MLEMLIFLHLMFSSNDHSYANASTGPTPPKRGGKGADGMQGY